MESRDGCQATEFDESVAKGFAGFGQFSESFEDYGFEGVEGFSVELLVSELSQGCEFRASAWGPRHEMPELRCLFFDALHGVMRS
ncbi:MAG TPA: hypothetical protein VER03_25705 [Bryobacteraceae bacterium]|nr:hypothetical protein [Bryobacteraceae bacterium]